MRQGTFLSGSCAIVCLDLARRFIARKERGRSFPAQNCAAVHISPVPRPPPISRFKISLGGENDAERRKHIKRFQPYEDLDSHVTCLTPRIFALSFSLPDQNHSRCQLILQHTHTFWQLLEITSRLSALRWLPGPDFPLHKTSMIPYKFWTVI